VISVHSSQTYGSRRARELIGALEGFPRLRATISAIRGNFADQRMG
jgi:hypothetical protein